MSATTTVESQPPGASPEATVHPPALSLPSWPSSPPEPDVAGAGSFLLVAIGAAQESRRVADRWLTTAEAAVPTTMLVLDDLAEPRDIAALRQALTVCSVGVRILLVGGQYDVLVALTEARAAGAIPAELNSYVVHTDDLPVFCAHCRSSHRATAAPGDCVTCPGCSRLVEIHPHLSATLGCFLASDSRARDLP